MVYKYDTINHLFLAMSLQSTIYVCNIFFSQEFYKKDRDKSQLLVTNKEPLPLNIGPILPIFICSGKLYITMDFFSFTIVNHFRCYHVYSHLELMGWHMVPPHRMWYSMMLLIWFSLSYTVTQRKITKEVVEASISHCFLGNSYCSFNMNIHFMIIKSDGSFSRMRNFLIIYE